jgi:hypothetical protein
MDNAIMSYSHIAKDGIDIIQATATPPTTPEEYNGL